MIIVISGKCESRGVLMGSNAAVMSVEFDYEVSDAATLCKSIAGIFFSKLMS